MRRSILFLLFVFGCFVGTAYGQTGTINLSVTSTPLPITVNVPCNYVVIQENTATPVTAFTITLPGASQGIAYPAGTKFIFSAAAGGFVAGQTIGTITQSAGGTVSFVGIESIETPTVPAVSRNGGGGGGGNSIFASYQFGSNPAITGSGNYLQTTYPSDVFTLNQGGLGTIGSPFVDQVLKASQTADTVAAGPCGGGPGTWTFRALCGSDLPASIAAGSTGDMQIKGSSSAFAAGHLNDNGTLIKGTEPIAFVGPRPFYDVTYYGADPTGVADSTTAITNAIAAACPGGYTYPPNNCAGDIYFPPGNYSVTQPGTGINTPIFGALGSNIHLYSNGTGTQISNQGAPLPPEAIINVSNCTTSSGLGPVFLVGYGANNVTFENLSIRGCNEAVYNQRGSFIRFNNVWMTSQRLSAPVYSDNPDPGSAPWYHAAYVGEDTLWTFFNGGGLGAFGTGYPFFVGVGDDCGGSPGSCPNIVGLLYFNETQFEGGDFLYLQTSSATGSPAGQWVFRNIVSESNQGAIIRMGNTGGAETYQIGPITLDNFGVADNLGATGYPIVQFDVNSAQGSIAGFKAVHSGAVGTSPILKMNHGSVSSYEVDSCPIACSSAIVDGNGNQIGQGATAGYQGVAVATDVTSNPAHLMSSAPGVAGNTAFQGPSLATFQQGHNFSTHALDASGGLMFGQKDAPGFFAQVATPSTSEFDINWAANYPPTGLTVTESNTGGSFTSGTYYFYMVSTTGDCVTSFNTAFSAPSVIYGPVTVGLGVSTASFNFSWTAAATGITPIAGYCIYVNNSPTYNPNLNAGPSPLISGASTTTYTLTSGTGFVGTGSFPVFGTMVADSEFKPGLTVLSGIGTPLKTASPPWTPPCFALATCGAEFAPMMFESDTFHRTTGIGSNWSYANGSTSGWAPAIITSNQAATNAGAAAWMNWTGITSIADQFSIVTIGNIVNGALDDIGTGVRGSGSVASNSLTGYEYICSSGASTLIKFVSGVQTNLATGGPACANGDTLGLIAVGTLLIAQHNGTQVLTATDSSITSGSPAFQIYGADTVSNWQGGSLTIGRGNNTIFAQQNWWSGEQDFYGTAKFNTAAGTGTTCAQFASDGTLQPVTPRAACNSGGGGGGVNITVNGGAALGSPVNLQNGPAYQGLTINALNPSANNVDFQLTGTLADAGLANAYSGVGTGAAHQFATALTRNAAPTFAQPTLADVASGAAGTGTYDFSGVTLLKLPATANITGLYYQTVIDGAGTTATQQPKIKFLDGTNMTITCANNGGASETDCTFTSSATGATAFSSLTAATNSNVGNFIVSGGNWDFSGGTWKAPSSAAYAPTTSAVFGYDSTNNKYVFGQNGSTVTLPVSQSLVTHQFLTAYNAATGAFTQQAIVASDVPTLNQNTTGSAATLAATSDCSANQATTGINTSGTAQGCFQPTLISGTPTVNQIAQWMNATTIQGLATTGSGNAVLATSPTLTTPNIGAATGTSVTVSGLLSGSTLSLGSCASSASPAVCGTSPTGSVIVAAGATTVVVDTSAVTANSQIMLTFDTSLGTRLSVTCNTTNPLPYVSARTAGTSFTITSSAPVTNPACISYLVVN